MLRVLRRSPSWKPSFLSHTRTACSSPGTRASLGAGAAEREEEEEEEDDDDDDDEALERDGDEAEEEEALEDEVKEESILLDVGLEEHGDACRVGDYSVHSRCRNNLNN